MTNVGNVVVAVKAASPPGKSEGTQASKGDDGFKKCLAACGEDETQEVNEKPVDEAAVQEAEAALLLMQMMPVQAQPVQVQADAAAVVAPEAESTVVAPVEMTPVQAPVQVEVEAKANVDAAPVKSVVDQTPVKAEAGVNAANFSESLKVVETGQKAEVQASAAVKVEAATVQTQTASVEAVAEQKPVVKTAPVVTVETLPVTTSENIPARIAVDLSSTPVEARPLELAQQLGKGIAETMTAGKNSLHVQIQPENMGRIDVHLVSKSDGMQVVLTTDSASTGKMLENNLSQLEKSLASAGLQISGLSVNSQGLQGRFTNSFKEQKSSTSRSYPNQSAVAAVPVEAIASRYSNPMSGYDFRV